MIQLFKKANAKSGSEKDGEQKWNGDSLFVKVDNEYVSLTELKRAAKENEYEPLLQKVENEIEMDGETHNVNDLIGLYKNNKKKNMTDKEDPALQAAKKGMPKLNKEEKEEDDEKENEMTTQISEGGTAGAKDNPNEVVEKAKKMSSKKNKEDEEDMKENEEDEEKEEKENEKSEEDAIEERISRSNKNGKKDLKHFVKLNSIRENGMLADTVTIDTMHNRIDRGRNSYGSGK